MKMKRYKLLLIILLIVGCDEPSIEGCMDESACNYSAIFEKADNSMCMELDCAGVCGGTCTVCECAGVCGLLNEGDAVKDIDENCYETVQIGEQLWMAENLKVTHYKDGSEIPTGFSNSEWAELETGAYTVYPVDYDEVSIATCGNNCADVYGNLYNWAAVDDERGICPEGYHVPTDAEWTTLIIYLDGDADPDAQGPQSGIAGGMLKDTGTIEDGDGLWYSPNEVSTNENGFTALPAGSRVYYSGGSYRSMGTTGSFWSSSEYGSNYAWGRDLGYYLSGVGRGYYSKQFGFSIRCLKD